MSAQSEANKSAIFRLEVKTLKQLASEFEVHVDTMRQWLRKMGVLPVKPGMRKKTYTIQEVRLIYGFLGHPEKV